MAAATLCRGRCGVQARKAARAGGLRRHRFIGAQLAVLGTEVKACRRRILAESGRRPARIATGPRWAPRGPTAGLARTWVGPSGSAQLDMIGFPFFKIFLKYIFSTKVFQRKSSNSFKALKILRKSQKFQENS
jgi:hypothetical protein